MGISRAGLGLVLLTAIAGLLAPCAVPQGSKSKPFWEINLKSYGFRTYRRGLVNDYGSLAAVACTRNVVAVAFDTEGDYVNNPKGGQRRWLGTEEIVGLFFDLDSGKLVAKRSWHTSFGAELFATPNGSFLLHLKALSASLLGLPPSPDRLLLLSSDGTELKRIEFPIVPSSRYWAFVSPSGASLLMGHYQEKRGDYQLFDADTLERRTAWEESDKPAINSVSDRQILRATSTKGAKQIYLGSWDSEGRLIPGDSAVGSVPRFFNNDLLIAFGFNPARIHIWKPSGEEVLTYQGAAGSSALLPVISADGAHFAANIREHGKAWSTYVWKSPDPKPVQVIEADGPMALSPDGKRIAIIEKAKLSLFRIAPGSN